jgi:hypothetical protein
MATSFGLGDEPVIIGEDIYTQEDVQKAVRGAGYLGTPSYTQEDVQRAVMDAGYLDAPPEFSQQGAIAQLEADLMNDIMIRDQLREEELLGQQNVEALDNQRGLKLDPNFLIDVEGFETNAYVPIDKQTKKAKDNSGVTIASGIDLGQWSEKDLVNLKVPQPILNKLKPYLGKKKDSAIKFLDNNPLSLLEAEAKELNNIFKTHFAEKIASRFNKDSNIKFEDLPSEVQTPLISVGFQYGNKMFKHNFWKQVTSGKWKDAYNNLMNYGDDYSTRRKKEAALLKSSGIF